MPRGPCATCWPIARDRLRLRAAMAAGMPALGPDHPWMGEAQAALAVAADARDDHALAADARRESERIVRLLPPDHPLRSHLLPRDTSS